MAFAEDRLWYQELDSCCHPAQRTSFVMEQGRASGSSRNVIGPQPSARGAAAALVAPLQSTEDFCSAQPLGGASPQGRMGASCEGVIQQLLLTDVQDCT